MNPFMLAPGKTVSKCLVAKYAMEWFVTSVNQLMILHVTFPAKCFCTKHALERLQIFVCGIFVPFEPTRRNKGLVTKSTLQLFNLGMIGPLMNVSVAPSRKHFFTEFALERSLPSMDSLMDYNLVFPRKTFLAIFARERIIFPCCSVGLFVSFPGV